MSPILRPCLAAVLALSLVACGDDDPDPGSNPTGVDPATSPDGPAVEPPATGGGDEPQSLSRLGVVGLVDDPSAGSPSASARFARYDGGADVQAFYGSVGVSPDTCVSGADALDAAFGGPAAQVPDRIGGAVPTDVDAGDALTLTGPGGTYGELLREVDGSDVRYAVAGDLPAGPIPEALRLDVPGAEFPAFADVDIAPARALEAFGPGVGEAVTADTVFTWTAGDDGDATVRIAIATEGGGTLACVATDDGEFAPSDAIGGAPAGGAAGEVVGAGRRTISIRSGDEGWLYVDSFAGSLPAR